MPNLKDLPDVCENCGSAGCLSICEDCGALICDSCAVTVRNYKVCENCISDYE
jgi:hypothetical protein